jgi:hypothetical protein
MADFEYVPELSSVRLAFGIGFDCDQRFHDLSVPVSVRRRGGGPGLSPAAPCKRLVNGNPCEPCGKLRAFCELIQVGERVDVRLLHHVFGFGLALQHGARDAIHALVVTSHEDFEQRGLARPYTRHL